MSVACIDTATTTPLVALLGDTVVDDRGARIEGRAQGILVALDELLGDAPRSSITAVVVGTGPGGFTGLRVGVSTARGIAETLGVPLLAVSSLDVVAESGGHSHAGTAVWVTLDACRGEWFAQRFDIDADGVPHAASPVLVLPTGELDEHLADLPRIDGADIDASALARAARRALARPAGIVGGNPLAVLPDYGRAPDATPPRMDVVTGPLGIADLDAILQLEARCFPTPWTRAMYVEEFGRPETDSVHLAARDPRANDRLVGAALAARIGDHWHVMNVLVDPIARRRGIAVRLLVELLDQTEAHGAGEGWTLEVRDGNDGAVALYEAHGFRTLGRRPGYYADTGEDALVMARPAGGGDGSGAEGEHASEATR